MATITARISVEAARIAVGVGRPQDHIVKELRVSGIPAVVSANGIDVERGFIHVYDEPQQVGGSLRVFEWTDEERTSHSSPSNEDEKEEAVESTPVNAPPSERKRKK
jgi:hypothetical protein